MRKTVYLFLFLLLPFGFIKGQETNYFDSPFGGGMGYTPGWFVPSLDGLNLKIKAFGTPEIGKNGFFTSGGGGFLYIGFVKNLRVGGMWSSGSTSEKAFDASWSGGLGLNKETDYTMSMGAFTVEYTLPIIKDIGVSVGAIIGGGSQTLQLYQSSGSADWNGAWDGFVWNNLASSSFTYSASRTLTNNFFLLAPTLNIDIPLYRFLAFRIGGGYVMKFGDTWKLDNDREILNTPDDLTKNSFFIQTGILIGFFSF